MLDAPKKETTKLWGETLATRTLHRKMQKGSRGMLSERCRQAEETRGFSNVNTLLILPSRKDVILLNWSFFFFLKRSLRHPFTCPPCHTKMIMYLKMTPEHVLQSKFNFCKSLYFKKTSIFILLKTLTHGFNMNSVQWLNAANHCSPGCVTLHYKPVHA